MLKRVLFLMTLVVFIAAGSACAAFMTWTDEIDFDPDKYISAQQDAFTFTHDIKDDGFKPREDFVFDYNITLRLYDDKDNNREFAMINLPGRIADGKYDFSLYDQEFGWSLLGWFQLNLFGELDVTVDAWWGDFYLDYSILTANGIGTAAPVPEPSTLILFGAGIAGLALYRRRKS